MLNVLAGGRRRSGGGPTILAARMASLTNGGSHRTSLGELEFLDIGGNPISVAGGTAFEGGGGSPNLPAANAFAGDADASYWSRVTSGGTGMVGMKWAGPITEPVACRFTTAGGADSEAPVTFIIEFSDDTTNGTDGTWTTAYTSGTEVWTFASQVRTFTF